MTPPSPLKRKAQKGTIMFGAIENYMDLPTNGHFITLDPALGYATTIDTYDVTPERVEGVLEDLMHSANDIVRHQAGFVSFNFHVSADRTKVVNYGQWRNREALGGVQHNPAITTQLHGSAQVSGHAPLTPYDLLCVLKAGATAQGGTTTLIPNNGQLTLINSYSVKPERADELIEFLTRATQETLCYVPGFISANLHLSLDRTRVVNYAQWADAQATAAAREDPKVGNLMRQQLQIADTFNPVPCSLRSSVPAA